MKKRFSEAQIIGFLKQIDAGMAVKGLCRKHGLSEASYYFWRSKFGGMDVSDAKLLKALESENTRLKRLLAESMLENEITREVLRKSSERTGQARGGPSDAGAGIDGGTRPGGRGHERGLIALRAGAGPQRGAAREDRDARAASPPLRRGDDLPQAPTGRTAGQPQAHRAAPSAGETAGEA